MNSLENKWLKDKHLSPQLKAQIEAMSASERQDAFYTSLKFGTAGMRGLLGPGPNRMNIYTIRKANVGFAKYILTLPEGKERGVAIAHDNRYYSKEFARESAEVLAYYGIKSYLFEDLRPTPELSFAVRHLGCAGGIMITASHNPKEYNGYKVYDDTGCQLVPELIDQVIGFVDEIKDELALRFDLSSEQKELILPIGEEVDEAYYKEVLSIRTNQNPPSSGLITIYTPQHGTGYLPVKTVMARAGYPLVFVEEQCTPDPAFSNTKTPNPEEPAAYEKAIALLRETKGDIAVATDPDGDRVGVVVSHNGEEILMSGNQTGAVLMEYLFSRYRDLNTMPENPVMFNTVVTGDLGEMVARAYGVDCEKTLTGFKFIGNKILGYEKSHAKNFVFGYEESYGYLIKPFVRDKDAVQAVLIIAECADYYKKQGKTLMDVLLELYQRFGAYKESQVSLTLEGEAGSKKIAAIMKGLQNNPPKEIAKIKVIRSEDFNQSIAKEGEKTFPLDFPKSEVLKYFLEDGSWIAVRPSGTEPKCKFYYCVKAKSLAQCEEKTKAYQNAMAAFAQ